MPANPITKLPFPIAALVTLVVAGALARAVGLIQSRVESDQTSSELQEQADQWITRLRSELERLTMSLGTSHTGTGYFVYHEGPTADATTTTFGDTTFWNEVRSAPESRDARVSHDRIPLSYLGDTDDYLAMTVKAPPGARFTGKVPWGVVEAARVQSLAKQERPYTLPPDYDPTKLVTIESQHAEVVYWMAPEVVTDSDGHPVLDASDQGDDTDGLSERYTPHYVDSDSDGFPDRFRLYRRVLLIRPDLNVNSLDLVAADHPQIGFDTLLGDQRVLGYLRRDGTVEPCGHSHPALNPGAWQSDALAAAPDWLIGMARVQQSMDLSVARETQNATADVSTGRPMNRYSANTLESLRNPRRRFAHVMAPGSVAFTRQILEGFEGCSLPLLALASPTRYLAKGPADPLSRLNLTQSPESNVCDHLTMVGHLRPEFALSGDREGQDVLSTKALAFDLQVLDPEAPVFVSVGPDAAPGIAGADDNFDGNPDVVGTAPDYAELGAMRSDDQVITANDPFFFRVCRDANQGAPIARGAFVDLGYAQQPGGNLRLGTGAKINSSYRALISSPMSGLSQSAGGNHIIDAAIGLRGKLVIDRNGKGYLQNTFDSFTGSYRQVGLHPKSTKILQRAINGVNAQTSFWRFNRTLADPKVSPTNSMVDAANIDPPPPMPLKSLKVSLRWHDPITMKLGEVQLIHDVGNKATSPTPASRPSR